MKALIKYLRPVAYILTLLFLFQGCAAYKRQNATLDQAVETRNLVKVVSKDNAVHKYIYITKKDDKYYGVKKVDGDLIETQLDEDDISRLQLYDKGTTAAIQVGSGLAIVGIVAGIVLLVTVFALF